MNEHQRKQRSESRVLDTRRKYSDLPEPEKTYAVEMDMAQEIERLKEELTEINWGGRE